MSAGIRAGPLHADQSLLVVDPKGASAMGVADENREFVVWVEPANRAGLFLSEVDAAIRGADETVGIVWSLSHELPFEATGNYSRDLRSGYVLGRRRLSEFLSASGIALLLLLLCDGDPAESYSRCN
jgi:hypothetical protein